MTWTLTNHSLLQEDLLNLESLFALGNGYLGVRGNFEEGYHDEMTSIRGTYQNAFHDIVEIPYGEKLYGFPDTEQKMLNSIDAQSVQIFLGEEEEPFSLFTGEILSYRRLLHLDQGFSERMIHWRSPAGKEIKLHFRRFVSFTTRELFAIDIRIEPINFFGSVKIVSTINGDVSNYVGKNDPRVSSHHGKRLHVKGTGIKDDMIFVLAETVASKLKTACVSRHCIENIEHNYDLAHYGSHSECKMTFQLTKTVQVTKWNIYVDTLRHEDDLIEKGIGLQRTFEAKAFDDLLALQKQYLADFWEMANITIEGDDALQEGIRFNLYQLLQSVGRDVYSNIAAKGLTGEGYGGHYFWDTEIYMIPVFILTKPEIAKSLLIYRYQKLEAARNRAKEMGHKHGALFPWRTISGTECSSYFPSGSAQYHISGDIAYSYIQYFLATGDLQFLKEYGAEMLVETARLWIEVGHYHDGKFKIDAVTGPDEYTCVINNNYYTNVIAKYNLQWAYKVCKLLKEVDSAAFLKLSSRLALTDHEITDWKKAGEAMYLPYDEKLKINPQDDTFLQKAVWDFDNTPTENYPLLLHYHPLTLYRYQVCKQADTVLAHFLLEDEQDFETIKNSYDYYEKITTHDSSLSSCIFSIMASKIGYQEKAYDYFIETARLDLDNTHGNTKDGLHMANMGGAWMAIVFGFAGLRIKETGLSLEPKIPNQWQRLTFRLQYQRRKLEVVIEQHQVQLTLLTGETLSLKLYGQDVLLQTVQPAILKTQLQAIIFDLDGVITDTAEFHYQAWKGLADKLSIPFSREFNEELKGISRMESLAKILIHGNRHNDFSDSEKMELAEEKNKEYIQQIEKLTPDDILPGIKQFIAECKKNKMKLALASNSKNAGTVMKALKLENEFDVIVDAKSIQNGKPDPEIFLTAAKLLNVDAQACIGIEDAAAGVEAIKAAGMYAVGVGKKETFKKVDYVVSKTDELIFEEILKRFYVNA